MENGGELTQQERDDIRNRPVVNAYPPEVNWNIVNHRLQYSAANKRQCECDTCTAYLAMIAEKYWKGVEL